MRVVTAEPVGHSSSEIARQDITGRRSNVSGCDQRIAPVPNDSRQLDVKAGWVDELFANSRSAWLRPVFKGIAVAQPKAQALDR
jgi:hypothetical protein